MWSEYFTNVCFQGKSILGSGVVCWQVLWSQFTWVNSTVTLGRQAGLSFSRATCGLVRLSNGTQMKCLVDWNIVSTQDMLAVIPYYVCKWLLCPSNHVLHMTLCCLVICWEELEDGGNHTPARHCSLWGRSYCFSHFRGEEVKAQRGWVTCLGHTDKQRGVAFEHKALF